MTAYEQSSLNILSPIFGGGDYISNHILTDNPDSDDLFFGDNVENRFQVFVYNSTTGYAKYLGWIMIPILGLFIIPGLFLTGKKLTKNKMIFLTFIVFLSIASLYAYGRGIQETRYLYPLIPIFILFACNFFSYLEKRYDMKKIMIVILSLSIVLSISFMEHDKNDYEYEREIHDATVFLIKIADGVNRYDGGNLRTASLENSWPELLPMDERKKMMINSKKISSIEYNSLNEFLKDNEKNGLSHLLIDDKNEQLFLKDIFKNEEKHEYLKKIFDSKEKGYKNHIKIFEIDYDRFNEIKEISIND